MTPTALASVPGWRATFDAIVARVRALPGADVRVGGVTFDVWPEAVRQPAAAGLFPEHVYDHELEVPIDDGPDVALTDGPWRRELIARVVVPTGAEWQVYRAFASDWDTGIPQGEGPYAGVLPTPPFFRVNLPRPDLARKNDVFPTSARYIVCPAWAPPTWRLLSGYHGGAAVLAGLARLPDASLAAIVEALDAMGPWEFWHVACATLSREP